MNASTPNTNPPNDQWVLKTNTIALMHFLSGFFKDENTPLDSKEPIYIDYNADSKRWRLLSAHCGFIDVEPIEKPSAAPDSSGILLSKVYLRFLMNQLVPIMNSRYDAMIIINVSHDLIRVIIDYPLAEGTLLKLTP